MSEIVTCPLCGVDHEKLPTHFGAGRKCRACRRAENTASRARRRAADQAGIVNVRQGRCPLCRVQTERLYGILVCCEACFAQRMASV